ncbi:hypothetical protein C2G38_2157820 [Gigaspora rosea]|uniref:Uncharacterized protein n=1 Tax=Gigaspora rosea TaxID=44941 RepID=A0A397W183_9GLOM|nr:hypothetical protein C2G38_2157820 [Gigaspora rosea]
MKDNNSSPSNNKPGQKTATKLQNSMVTITQPNDNVIQREKIAQPPRNHTNHKSAECRNRTKAARTEPKAVGRNHEIHNNEAIKAEITIARKNKRKKRC